LGIEEARIPVAAKATKLFCAHLPVVKNCSFQSIRGERWALIVRR
jgi:hypothetical protein